MNVISRKKLVTFWIAHADAMDHLAAWFKATRKATWTKWADVQAVYPRASYHKCCLIFNICGNDYRLVVRRSEHWKTLYVIGVFTHAECDRDEWKKRCSCQKSKNIGARKR